MKHSKDQMKLSLCWRLACTYHHVDQMSVSLSIWDSKVNDTLIKFLNVQVQTAKGAEGPFGKIKLCFQDTKEPIDRPLAQRSKHGNQSLGLKLHVNASTKYSKSLLLIGSYGQSAKEYHIPENTRGSAFLVLNLRP